MRKFFSRWKRPAGQNSRRGRLKSQRGQTMSEYALIVAAVALVVVGSYRTMATNLQSVVNKVDSQL